MIILPHNRIGIKPDDFQKIGIIEDLVYSNISKNRSGRLKTWDSSKIDGGVYVHYDSLPSQRQDDFKKKVCNGIEPLTFIRAKAFEAFAANAPGDYYEKLRELVSDAGTRLSEEQARKYAHAATIFWVWANRKGLNLKQNGFPKRDDILTAIKTLKGLYSLPIPATVKELTNKEKEWNLAERKGRCPALCMVHKNFGTQAARKVAEVQKAIIEEMASKHQGLSFAKIMREYNAIADTKGYRLITSPNTVLNNISMPAIVSMRYGKDAHTKTIKPVISRTRPDAANTLWVGDGWTVELYYQKHKSNGDEVTGHWFRKMAYMVIDAYNDTIVGYHLSDTETIADSKQAWKNACVWNGLLPKSIKTDNFAKKELTAFFQSVAQSPSHYQPSAVGNARDKVIEQFFNKFNTECLQKYPNWAGRGIKSKTTVNGDYLDKIKHDFPTEEGVISQFVQAVGEWNAATRKGAQKPRQIEWKEAAGNDTRLLGTADRLLLFGVPHTRPAGYTNMGINITLGGNKVKYQEWENESMLLNIGKEYEITYDPENLSEILIHRDGMRERHVLKSDTRVPMSPFDFTDGQRTELNGKLNMQKRALEIPVERGAKRHAILVDAGLPELLDKAYAEAVSKVKPITAGRQKGALNAAENIMKQHALERFSPYGPREMGELE